jgi:hypothetical protein
MNGRPLPNASLVSLLSEILLSLSDFFDERETTRDTFCTLAGTSYLSSGSVALTFNVLIFLSEDLGN